MSEQEKIDQLLRQVMSSTPPPSLSSNFDRQLSERLRPRRLSSSGRRVMFCYAVLSVVLSLWVMRSQSIAWPLVITAVVAPLLIVFAVNRRVSLRLS